jgi:hypothetical protein
MSSTPEASSFGGIRASFQGVKRPRREADDSFLSNSDVQNAWGLQFNSLTRLHDVVLN